MTTPNPQGMVRDCAFERALEMSARPEPHWSYDESAARALRAKARSLKLKDKSAAKVAELLALV